MPHVYGLPEHPCDSLGPLRLPSLPQLRPYVEGGRASFGCRGKGIERRVDEQAASVNHHFMGLLVCDGFDVGVCAVGIEAKLEKLARAVLKQYEIEIDERALPAIVETELLLQVPALANAVLDQQAEIERYEERLNESGDWYGQMEIERLRAEIERLKGLLELAEFGANTAHKTWNKE